MRATHLFRYSRTPPMLMKPAVAQAIFVTAAVASDILASTHRAGMRFVKSVNACRETPADAHRQCRDTIAGALPVGVSVGVPADRHRIAKNSRQGRTSPVQSVAHAPQRADDETYAGLYFRQVCHRAATAKMAEPDDRRAPMQAESTAMAWMQKENISALAAQAWPMSTVDAGWRELFFSLPRPEPRRHFAERPSR